jgi:hypothetical protein
MEFPISSHRVAYHLNKLTNSTHYTKGSLVECRVIINILLSDQDRETKKVFFNEILDMCHSMQGFYDFFENPILKEEIKSIVKELKKELESGEAQEKEREFEELYAKIQHRKRIIGDI